MKHGKIVLVSTTLAAVLAGCATHPAQQAQTADDQQLGDVMSKISEATTLAVDAQRELAMTADAKVAHDAILRKRLLSDVVNFDFYGDIEDIVREIAMKYAYTFSVYGKRPPERVNVNVYVKKMPVIEVLKQIAYQSPLVDIKLTDTAIEIHYKEAAGISAPVARASEEGGRHRPMPMREDN